METEQLVNFLKVAEHKNFTRAAADIGLSQPALSRSIGRLEDELGQPVFDRKTRSVELNEAGELLQARATEIIRLIEDTKAEISDDGEKGQIRIAGIPTITPYFVPSLLRNFSKQFPQATVTVQEDTTDNLVKRCTQGEIDLAILAIPVTAKYLEIETLYEEELFLVLPKGHPLADKKQIKVADIDPLPFILLDEAHCLSDNIVTFCKQRSVQPVSVERTSQLATVQELVSLDHGVSMIPEMARRLDKNKNRVYRSLVNPKPTRKIAMLWNPYRFQSKLVLQFMDVLREYSKSMEVKI